MPGSPATPTTLPVEALRAEFTGRVITPGDEGYDDARATFFVGPDLRPALIVQVADTTDVARVIALARETGLELAIRGGAHSNAGHSTTDGGIVLDTSALKSLEIDVPGRTAWAGAGLTASELTTALGAHGLVLGFGDTGSVGIGGITLGGGVGYLVRAHGLTIDNLLAAEIVTADGQVLVTDAETHPDLFWALRGGGGNFGVVTRFRFRLHELPAIVGGMLLLPARPEVIAGFIAACEAAPDELSAIGNVMPAPPMPFLPPEQHGKLVILSLMAYAGDGDAAQGALAPFRALAEPIADMLRPMPYAEMFPPEEAGGTAIGVSRTLFVDEIDEAVAHLIVDRLEEHLRTTSAQMAVAQLRVLGGAMARVPADATAYAHRTNRIMVNVAALVGSLDEIPEHQPWVEAFARELNQGDDAAYLNFLSDEGEGRVRAAYPGRTWDRLVAVKRRYDPTNLFHRNQNIPPGDARQGD